MMSISEIKAQYGSLANDIQEMKLVEATEPNLNFLDSDNKTVLFSIRSSGLSYNREAFPNDSFTQAAEKIAACITKNFGKTLNLKLNAYKDIEEKVFVANGEGVYHNYEVDTWHYWMLDKLSSFIKHSK